MYYKNEEFDKLIEKMLEDCNKSSTKRIWSYEVANILKKDHHKVLRDIREELNREDMDFEKPDFFWYDEYLDSYGRLQPAYTINSEGILYLAGRYSRYNYRIRNNMIREHKRLNYVMKRTKK